MRDLPGLAGRLARPLATLGAVRLVAVSVLAGAVTGLGQAPFSLEPFGVAGLFAGLALFAVADDARRAALAGWAYGTGYFALTLFWIVEPFLVDAARHGWMAPFALVFMAGGLALFWGAAFGLARRIASGPAGGAVAWAAAMTLAELARGYVLTGFPWVLAGYIWTDSGALQWASLAGPFGLTALTLALVAAVWIALSRVSAPLWLAAAPLPFAAFVAAGAAMAPPPDDLAGRPVVRLVQPNAPQDEKWVPEKVREFYRRQLDFTAEPADPLPDLTVWPETAIPWLLEDAGPILADVALAAGDRPVAIGLQRREGARYFNTLAVTGPGGTVGQVYDKHKLVPFGEYIPFGGLSTALGLRSFAAQAGYGYSSGPGARLLSFGPLGTALPLICYEAIFPQNMKAGVRPDWMLQVTNDAWFGKVSGPYQHLAQARVRAVEQGLPMIRVANTGVSAAIDAGGRILAEIPLGEAGWRDVRLPPAHPPTLYARTGDWPVLVLALAALGLSRRRSRVSH